MAEGITSTSDRHEPVGVGDCEEVAPRMVPVVHDEDGTWFAPSGLWITLLTEEEMLELDANGYHDLVRGPGSVRLSDALTEWEREVDWA